MSERLSEQNGLVFSFEGGDGSGKGTQSKLFYDWLVSEGVPVKFDSFPRYHTPTGQKVAAYLNGELGDKVDARTASKLFSDDRLAAKDEIYEWLDEGGVWDFDRYVDSNKGHQGGKLETRTQRIELFNEIDALEFGQNGLPVPDMTFLFKLPPEIAQRYVDQKMARAYTDKKRDIHEADPLHLQNANESFQLFAELNPGRVRPIDVMHSNGVEMRQREHIHADVIAAARPLLEIHGLLRPR